MQIAGHKVPRIRFFPIFYSGTFTLFTFLLFALLLVTPGDHIYQSMRAGELTRIIITGAVYVLTFVIALFIYAARLFSTRSALANIPREWNLGGDEMENPSLGIGMSRRMGRLVREGWEASAIITYENTPRALHGRSQIQLAQKIRISQQRPSEKLATHIAGAKGEPLWGKIQHPGWSSPESMNVPNLHFEPVIAELPHLFEAKVVSLAPIPLLQQEQEDGTTVDQGMLDLLRRPVDVGMREYLKQLTDLGVLPLDDGLCEKFLSSYEQARNFASPLSEDEFILLMSQFSELMRQLEGQRAKEAARLLAASLMDSTMRRSSNASAETTRHHTLPDLHFPLASVSSRSEAEVTAYTAPSRFRYSRNISDFTGSAISDSDGENAHVTQIETMETRSQLSSITAKSSSVVSSQGSVIRAGGSTPELNIPIVHDHESNDDI